MLYQRTYALIPSALPSLPPFLPLSAFGFLSTFLFRRFSFFLLFPFFPISIPLGVRNRRRRRARQIRPSKVARPEAHFLLSPGQVRRAEQACGEGEGAPPSLPAVQAMTRADASIDDADGDANGPVQRRTRSHVCEDAGGAGGGGQQGWGVCASTASATVTAAANASPCLASGQRWGLLRRQESMITRT
ncbi:hypothetical protein C8R47DRAFT_67565 [Mycena vitilis]|nr:hypothetical protein C8R47DRAFT_67565 [Mycena vitilis]